MHHTIAFSHFYRNSVAKCAMKLKRPPIRVSYNSTSQICGTVNHKLLKFNVSQKYCQNAVILPFCQRYISMALLRTSSYSHKTFSYLYHYTANNFSKNNYQIPKEVEQNIEKENIWTIPNLLCITRIGLTPVISYFVLSSQMCPALILLVMAGLTDLFDGLIARTVPGQASTLGSFLDPLADKVLVSSIFLSLTVVGIIPYPLTGVIIGRDALLMVGAAYIRYKSIPEPKTFGRFIDFTNPTAQLSPTLFSKLNTFIQMTLLVSSFVAPIFNFSGHEYLQVLWWITGATTMGSGIQYVFSKNTYKFLHGIKKQQQL